MYRIEGFKKRDPVLRWNLPDRIFFACGACHILAHAFLEKYGDPAFKALWIRPAGSFIRIDVIRELCRVLAMRPYEASYRVVIICNAQAMNQPAGNALLKVLEEPPQGTIFILTADSGSGLLPTVLLCRRISRD